MQTDYVLDGIPRATSISLLMDWSGAKVYMTRPALRELAEKFLQISEADPAECNEVHLGSFFSHWDGDESLIRPRTRFANGLAPHFDRAQGEFWSEEVASGELNFGGPPGFDVTIMHVSSEAILEESHRPDE